MVFCFQQSLKGFQDSQMLDGSLVIGDNLVIKIGQEYEK